MRFLVVEDDPSVVRLVRTCLRMRWNDAEIDWASNGSEAIDLVRTTPPDLMVLDLGLPDGNGLDVLERVRETSKVPIVILTGSDDQSTRVLGLEAGADDFVQKPFNHAEFLARVNAVLRRVGVWDEQPSKQPAPAPADSDGLTVDAEARRVLHDGVEVRLTPTEWDVFMALYNKEGRVVTIRELSEQIWDTPAPQTPAIRSVIRRLRLKLEQDPAEPRIITSFRSVGYRFESPAG